MRFTRFDLGWILGCLTVIGSLCVVELFGTGLIVVVSGSVVCSALSIFGEKISKKWFNE